MANAFLKLVLALSGAHIAPAQSLDPSLAAGSHDAIVFDEYSPLAASDELQRRVLRPLLVAELAERAHARGEEVSAQSIDPAAERFAYYVPRGDAPPAGYGVLVFVPPWPRATLPPAWFAALDRHAMILVTAARSGNEDNVLGRRIPLALTGYANIALRFPIDRTRVYVGGWSGGARVALRIALGYPDVFRGALLNAGADPIGSADVPLPPQELFDLVERGSRFVYATGSRDHSVVAMDERSRDSARALCLADLVDLPMRNQVHELIDATTFERALQALDAPRRPDPGRLVCDRQRSQHIAAAIAAVESALGEGRYEQAAHVLDDLDAHFGALALPKSLALRKRIRAARLAPTP